MHFISRTSLRGIEMKKLILLFCGAALSGCATGSFAPPPTNLTYELEIEGGNKDFASRCKPTERTKNNTDRREAANYIRIPHTAAGSQLLIDNFIYTYRCSAHSAANGKQGFEIPSLLIAAGSATALALGAPSEVAIGGGAATSLLSTGKNYYAPQTKAEIFDSAMDALLCIKNVSVGIDPITIDAISAAEKSGSRGLAAAAQKITTLSAEERYFASISSALLSVERVLAQRLRSVGSFDPTGVIAEIKALTIDEKNIEMESEKSAMGQVEALNKNAPIAASATKVAQTIVKLETIQPKLQQCVVRAKI